MIPVTKDPQMKVINITILVTDEQYIEMTKKDRDTWLSSEARLNNVMMIDLINHYNLSPEQTKVSSVNFKVEL